VEAREHLRHVDGVMLGRASYHTPWLLAEVDTEIFGEPASVGTREDVLDCLRPYALAHLAGGGRLNNITRHILGLYHARPGARVFRRFLSEHAVGAEAGIDVLDRAIEAMREVARATEATRYGTIANGRS
jgi:tRNA-dihydrouridine synthase A